MKRQDASGESQGEEYPSDEPAAVRGLVWPLSFCFGRRKEREGHEKEVGDGEKGGGEISWRKLGLLAYNRRAPLICKLGKHSMYPRTYLRKQGKLRTYSGSCLAASTERNSFATLSFYLRFGVGENDNHSFRLDAPGHTTKFTLMMTCSQQSDHSNQSFFASCLQSQPSSHLLDLSRVFCS